MRRPQRYARSADVAVARAVDGTLYVMLLPDGPPRALNESAEVIWDVTLSGSEHIVEEVAAAFDLDPEAIADDVGATLRSLTLLGLIEPLRNGSST